MVGGEGAKRALHGVGEKIPVAIICSNLTSYPPLSAGTQADWVAERDDSNGYDKIVHT